MENLIKISKSKKASPLKRKASSFDTSKCVSIGLDSARLIIPQKNWKIILNSAQTNRTSVPDTTLKKIGGSTSAEAAPSSSICQKNTIRNLKSVKKSKNLVPTKSNECKSMENVSESVSFSFKSIPDDSVMIQLSGISIESFSNILALIKSDYYKKSGYSRKVSFEDRLLLFFMKMKLGLNFFALGFFFKVSHVTASSIFHNILNLISANKDLLLNWPTKESVKKYISPLFRNFNNCRAVVDFIELKFYTSHHIHQKALIHSNYKDYFIVKYLIAIAPTAVISFVSKCYDINATNHYILEDSGFLNKLEPGDVIISLKNLEEVKNQFEQKETTLICDSNSTKNQQISTELNENNEMDSIILFAGKIFRKVQKFHIFHNLSTDLFPHIDKIVFSACAFANTIK